MPPLNFPGAPLGQQVPYTDCYAPDRLFGVPRGLQRPWLAANRLLPFEGADVWRGYEVSWLNAQGKPEVGIVTLEVPASSPRLIESKSMKLYLNSFNQTVMSSARDVQTRIAADLSRTAGSVVNVHLAPLANCRPERLGTLPGTCLDALAITCEHYTPTPSLLTTDPAREVEETLVSHLLKSNCWVTGQPDWATVQLHYRGPAIDHAGLLAYWVSFRQHQGFHEAVVEQIFVDVMARCQPASLTVLACYTRRGGLDINPYRSTEIGWKPSQLRTLRQ